MSDQPLHLSADMKAAIERGFEPSLYRPGALAAVIAAHMDYYAQNWGFGAQFETKLAREMGAFLQRCDPERDLFLCLWKGGELAGSITIDADDPEGPHLRWFIVSNGARGAGLGGILMRAAMDFTDRLNAAKPVWLTTFAGLDVAEKLYLAHGFVLSHELDDDQWKGGVRERRYERTNTAKSVS